MPRDRESAGACQQCDSGQVNCTHNYFADEKQQIDSWEHRCTDCSFRETEAFRIDEDNPTPVADPKKCPFCGRAAPPV